MRVTRPRAQRFCGLARGEGSRGWTTSIAGKLSEARPLPLLITLTSPSVHAQNDRPDFALRGTGRSENRRSYLDDCLHHAQPRLSCVRHPLRHE